MTDTSMSICIACDEHETFPIWPSFDWEGGDLRDWFYNGFISTFIEPCQAGQEFLIYIPFMAHKQGFSIRMPTLPWAEVEEKINQVRMNPSLMSYVLQSSFQEFEFTSESSIEENFTALEKRIKREDPWWNKLSFKFVYFEPGMSPLPWPDDGRVIVKLAMEGSL